MTIAKIKKLAKLSYKNDKLDSKTVLEVANLLKKADLRLYIKYLRLIERSKTVTVILPKKVSSKIELKFKKMYKDKIVNFVYDPDLIVGFKILDNDFVYEYNLKDTINSLGDIVLQ
jgi:F0F1-type ATP synthase delta subunit